jgi:CelD/BcsL family acetyltransferase involved in cellulose biosynthesis
MFVVGQPVPFQPRTSLNPMMARIHPIKFVIGSRPIAQVRRRIVPVVYDLPLLIQGRGPDVPPLSTLDDGYQFLSIPEHELANIAMRFPRYLVGKPQIYARFYIDMSGNFDEYMAKFSGKTRSTLNRKSRKFAEYCGGSLDIKEYRTATELEEFIAFARPLSALTYQERLLDSGLPTGDAAVAGMVSLANEDRIRAYLLFADGKPVSYLYLPITQDVLVYAFLGYHPDYMQQSVGTILQMEALKRLFAEERYRYFDFTEGEGSHKALFGTDHIRAATLLVLRPTLTNRLILVAHSGFNATIASIKQLVRRSGGQAAFRKLLRR